MAGLLLSDILTETSDGTEESLQLLRGGDLKAAFLGKYEDAELKLQVVCNSKMVSGKVRKECLLSDSRDCSPHWMIHDTLLVDLIKRGCQPIISASSWAIETQGDQPILDIKRYAVLSEELHRIGWPVPIKSHFFRSLVLPFLSFDTSSFTNLSPELVVMVASHLDIKSYIALAMSSKRIHHILSSETQWKWLLKKKKLSDAKPLACDFDPYEYITYSNIPNEVHTAIMIDTNYKNEEKKEEMKRLAHFLNTVEDPDNKLLLITLHYIIENYSIGMTETEKKFIDEISLSLSCPCKSIHQVSCDVYANITDFDMRVRGEEAEPLQKVVEFKRKRSHDRSKLVGLFRQKEKLNKLALGEATITGGKIPKVMEHWMKLLKKCKKWRIEMLSNIIFDAEDNSFGMPEELTKELARGSIGTMFINDRSLTQSNRTELEKVWTATTEQWKVLCSFCKKVYMECITQIEGWPRILELIESIETKKHDHYKICPAVQKQ